MKVGFIGLGRMGLNMVTRLRRQDHEIVAYDIDRQALEEAAIIGVRASGSLKELVEQLSQPRVIWIMVPAGKIVASVIEELSPFLGTGDIVVDGGNSNFRESKLRAERFAMRGIEFVDVGTSGGIWGLEGGYCLMVGGNRKTFDYIEPLLKALAPPEGYLYVGSNGAGHYVKMIHNGIEYAMMQAYAEGFEIMEKSEYGVNLAEICHLWNRGSVIRSWLLELAEGAFAADPRLEKMTDYVEDSGEGRWTVTEAMDNEVPAVGITYALMSRFRSRQQESFANKVLVALRHQFGGHPVKGKE